MENIIKGGYLLQSADGDTLSVPSNKIEMLEKLKSNEFIVFDLETTALKADINYGKIIEIGAVKIKDGEVIDRFSTFINPGMKIPQKIISLTGITDEMVKDAPNIFDAVREFNKFIGKQVLVAHNAKFDIPYLEYWLNKIGQFYEGDSYICTMELDKLICPGALNHKLCTCISRYGIVNNNAHRAVDDAEVTAKLLLCLKKDYEPFLLSLNYTYSSIKKEVEIEQLKVRSCADWKKPASKTNVEFNRLYINLYYPKEQLYGTVYYDRIKNLWFNKDFPDTYTINFQELEILIKSLRKGVL